MIRRCMADVEIGLLLSGGLDSSILGAIMMQPHIKKHLTGLLLFFRKISGLCMMKFSFYLEFKLMVGTSQYIISFVFMKIFGF